LKQMNYYLIMKKNNNNIIFYLLKGIYKIFNKSLTQHLNNHKLILSQKNVIAILTLSINIFKSSNYSQNVLTELASEILTVTSVVKLFLDLKSASIQSDILINDCNLACRLYPLLTNKEAISFIEGISFN
jgi:hypothetical protein